MAYEANNCNYWEASIDDPIWTDEERKGLKAFKRWAKKYGKKFTIIAGGSGGIVGICKTLDNKRQEWVMVHMTEIYGDGGDPNWAGDISDRVLN